MSEKDKKNHLDEGKHRLGVDYTIREVDEELVEPFAKATRVIGAIAIVVFLAWGLFYEWSSSSWGYGISSSTSPFQTFLMFFGPSKSEASMLQWIMAVMLFCSGWMLRFPIGNLLVVVVLKAIEIFKNIFRKI